MTALLKSKKETIYVTCVLRLDDLISNLISDFLSILTHKFFDLVSIKSLFSYSQKQYIQNISPYLASLINKWDLEEDLAASSLPFYNCEWSNDLGRCVRVPVL